MSDSTVGAEASPRDDANETAAPRLKRLKINKFRNVRPTELVFDDEWNVLLGKNSTGKTTLLELIAATIRGDVGAFEDVDLDIEAELMLGPAKVKWMLRGVPTYLSQRSFQADFSCDGLKAFTASNSNMEATRRGLAVGEGPANYFLMLTIHQPNGFGENDPYHDAVRAASISGDVQRFDEILTLFNRIGPTGDLVLSSDPRRRSLTSSEVVRAFGDSLNN